MWRPEMALQKKGRRKTLVCLTLWIHIPSEKVFILLKTPQTTFLEGIWIPGVRSLCFGLTEKARQLGEKVLFFQGFWKANPKQMW